MSTETPKLRLGTRGSELAVAQTEETKRWLQAAHPDLAHDDAVEIVIIKTTGDIEQKRRLAEIGGKGLFVKELEDALHDGRIDAAVHSMKDVPTRLPEGLILTAMLPRVDPRDAWFCDTADSIAALPRGAVVGTGSPRRQAQVMAQRPDLKVVNFRGNVHTRLRKLQEGEVTATMLAMAGLQRMGMSDKARMALEPDELLPAVGQGAIGVEVREGDSATIERMRAIDHAETSHRVGAERACLDVLGGSCRTPIGVLAELSADKQHMRLRALLAATDGSQMWRAERNGPAADADAMARDAGAQIRTDAGEAFFEALADLF